MPGIQPIHSFKQISGFAARCGASIPTWLAERFDGLDEDPETHALVASAVAAEQVLELVDEGITEFHFFTLNRSNLVLALARLLGVRPDLRAPPFSVAFSGLGRSAERQRRPFTVWPCFSPPRPAGRGGVE